MRQQQLKPVKQVKLLRQVQNLLLLVAFSFRSSWCSIGAVDTAQRTQKYKQTGNKLDGIQAWMSGVSTATGATGIGEVVSMPLDIVNLVIDAARYKRKGPIKGSRARFN